MHIIGKHYEEMDDKETIVKVTTILERLVLEVEALSGKIDDLKDGHVQETNTQIALLKSRIDTIDKERETEKTRSFWLLTAIITEGLAIAGSIIIFLITKPPQ